MRLSKFGHFCFMRVLAALRAAHSHNSWISFRGALHIRFFNVFGPRQDPRSAYAAAVPIFLHRALSGEPITVYGDGGQTRDFIFIKDIVGALAFAAETPHATGVFNAGYGKSIAILELVQEILRLTGSKSDIRFEPVRAGDIRHSTSDPSKLLAAGWKPCFEVASGLGQILDCTPKPN
jgi:UDP-glucose 4-epimerase